MSIATQSPSPPAAEAIACLSGHGDRPLSTEYWSRSAHAMYRAIPAAELPGGKSQ